MEVAHPYSGYSSTLFLVELACENIRFSSLFAAGDVSRVRLGETSPAAKSEEKWMFSRAMVELEFENVGF